MDLEERITKLTATLNQVTQDLEELRKDVRSSRPKPSSSGKQSRLSSALNTPTADLSKPGSSSTKPIKTEPSSPKPSSPKPDLSSKIVKATTKPKVPSAALPHSSTASATSSITTQVNAQKEVVDDVSDHGKKRKIELEDSTESEARNKKPKLDIQEDDDSEDDDSEDGAEALDDNAELNDLFKRYHLDKAEIPSWSPDWMDKNALFVGVCYKPIYDDDGNRIRHRWSPRDRQILGKLRPPRFQHV